MLNGLLKGYASSYDLVALSYPNPAGDLGRIDLVEPATFKDPLATFNVHEMAAVDAKTDLSAEALEMSLFENAPTSSRHRGTSETTSALAVVGLDAPVPVVHPDNQLDAISVDDIAGLLNGRIDNWSQLGGQDLPISVILPQTGSVLEDTLKKCVALVSNLSGAGKGDLCLRRHVGT